MCVDTVAPRDIWGETLLEQGPGSFEDKKLCILRKYYESVSWPCWVSIL